MPKEQKIVAWAKQHGIETKNLDELYSNPKVVQEVLKSMNATAEANKKGKFEQLSAIHITSDTWTPGGLLTEAQKLKRNEIYKEYKKDLDALYAKHPE